MFQQMDHKEEVIKKAKSDIIKAPKGKKASTVVAKIMFNDDDPTPSWEVLVTWKQAKIKNVHMYADNLLDIIKQVKIVVWEGLVDLMGLVQEVDVILQMPVIDHKMTVTFKEAMKNVASN